MPRPGLRSHSQAREFLTSPGNRHIVHYSRRKPKQTHCSLCKRPISSIPRKRSTKMRKTPKSDRRPNRLESGRYCAKCLQLLLKESIWRP